MPRNRSGMGTIFIHYHPHDLFAAEIIAGALVDCGDVILRPHALYGHAPTPPERLAVDWHVALWTPSGASLTSMVHLANTLAQTRGPLMLLTFDESFAPQNVRAEQQFPLFDRGVDWRVYRAGLRQRLRYAVETYPRQERIDSLVLAARNVDQAVQAFFASRFVLPALILFGVFVWTLR